MWNSMQILGFYLKTFCLSGSLGASRDCTDSNSTVKITHPLGNFDLYGLLIIL